MRLLSMMSVRKPLILIHGPMGVGKTTVCRRVLERLDRAAWLDGDWCWTMHPWSFSERNRAMALSNIAHVLTGFLENPEFDIVLFSWVIHLPDIFDTLLSALPAGTFDPLRVTLVASPEALRERCRADGRDEESVVRSLERLPLYRAFPDSLLDTTQMSRDEVAERVLDRIAERRLLGS